VTSNLYILVLFSSLNKTLELTDATARRIDRANSVGTVSSTPSAGENSVGCCDICYYYKVRSCIDCSARIPTFAFESTYDGDIRKPHVERKILGCTKIVIAIESQGSSKSRQCHLLNIFGGKKVLFQRNDERRGVKLSTREKKNDVVC